MLELWLFTTDLDFALVAEEAGISSIIVDWESQSKKERQAYTDFECKGDTLEDLERISSGISKNCVCRVNASNPLLRSEIDQAIAVGADIIFLPMAKDEVEVEEFMSYVDERAKTGVLIETKEAVGNAEKIAKLKPDFIYVGLNDLSISRGHKNIFRAVLDGTVEKLREIFKDQLFGFGGVTVVDGGYPIPASLLLKEMSSLECDFSFLRRSFKKDIIGRDMKLEVSRINENFEEFKKRSTEEIAADLIRLKDVISNAESSSAFQKTDSIIN